MNTTAAYRLEIVPHADKSPAENVREICDHISTYVAKFYKDRKLTLLPLQFEGGCVSPRPGDRIWSSRFICLPYVLANVEWRIAWQQTPNWALRISCTCAADERGIEFYFDLQNGLESMIEHPNAIQWSVPAYLSKPRELLSSILGRWVATADGWPVPVTPHFLQADDVDGFVDRCLVNPKRSLSVVLLAADGRFKSPPKIIQEIQRTLLGTAHVAALMNPDATKRLTALLGPERACPKGILRIYRQRFERDSPPDRHPILYAHDIPNQPAFEGILLKQVNVNHLHRFPDGPILNAARAAVCVELRQNADRKSAWLQRIAEAEGKNLDFEAKKLHLQDQRDEARKHLVSWQGKAAELSRTILGQAEELSLLREQRERLQSELSSARAAQDSTLVLLSESDRELDQTRRHLQIVREGSAKQRHSDAARPDEELHRAWQEHDQTLAELEATRQNLAALQVELDISRENLELLAANPGGKRVLAPRSSAAPPPQAPATILDALRFAAERNADVLDIWNNAWTSAKCSAYPSPIRVLQVLHAIADVGRAHFAAAAAGRSLGPLEPIFQTKVPFKYAHCESEMTMAVHGNERVFQGPERRREIQRHFTLGGGGTCIQIYFDFDDASGKVIVAHCGRHLPNYRQS